MKQFTIFLKSDDGVKLKYQTLSTSVENATKTALKVTLAPESAIYKIKIKDL